MDLVANFQRQIEQFEELGSPMYADLLRRVVDDYELGGVSSRILAGCEDLPQDYVVALPLLGAVHRMVLEGEAPELAVFYPSVGGEWDPVLGWEAFEQLLSARVPELRSLLSQVPQTNEVGRSIALYGGLLRLLEDMPLPVRLLEIGSSAGLNLRADHYRYLADGESFGPADSPVVFEDAWSGRSLVPAPGLRIAERVGSDVAPVDALSSGGALTLTSYVWPDQAERLERLRGALAIARSVPADVRREDAVSFLRNVELSEGHVTVIWHSVMWFYLRPDEQAEALGLIDALGERATSTAPLAHLRLEHDRRTPDSEVEFLIVLETWPGGSRQVLGSSGAHGLPVRWE
ncbi:DUF2332 domain-containing protein [Kribbella koreensis]|uniref:DUF2332 domain-containing protein n=1 Tax=Kribbella koreensis TaxID=57909 RepID=A0ABP3ZIK9_9ACTN